MPLRSIAILPISVSMRIVNRGNPRNYIARSMVNALETVVITVTVEEECPACLALLLYYNANYRIQVLTRYCLNLYVIPIQEFA